MGSPANSSDNSFLRENAERDVRHRHGEVRGDAIPPEEELREYAGIARDIIEHHMGRQVYQAVLYIIKSILIILIFMLLCFLLGYDWIPRILSVIMMIATGLRYGWLRWYGRRETVIRIPVD